MKAQKKIRRRFHRLTQILGWVGVLVVIFSVSELTPKLSTCPRGQSIGPSVKPAGERLTAEDTEILGQDNSCYAALRRVVQDKLDFCF